MSLLKLKIMLKSRFFGENLRAHYYAAFWLSDGSTKTCASCDEGFSLLNRRHHCRLCGYIFHSGTFSYLLFSLFCLIGTPVNWDNKSTVIIMIFRLIGINCLERMCPD